MLKVIKIRLKLLKTPCERYPKACYDMLDRLNNVGKFNWVTHVQNIICTTGFGHVWFSHMVGDEIYFINMLKERLNDNKQLEW